ncbi:RNA-binding protein [Kytococcus schroeteri]|uniref:RNA-binding protein n=1 Tax=Kytococcus schroeteri TaxID=138300 RepID=A0A2I1PC16_9MICO|nr:CGNR zinc finger domain-containing protein [Kytococcus schroeteri]PKZ42165.1 RNA-binding protein [Kytococcus schroeteri]
MHFTHDTDDALQGAAALVNTAPGPRQGDLLPDTAALEAFEREWGWTGRFDDTEEELAEVRAVRDRLATFWRLDPEPAAGLVNDLLAEYEARPRLVRHDDYGWHVHAVSDDAPLAARMAVEAALALADVLRADAWDRLATCAAEDCAGVLVDTSRNRSRRFCSTACGNRQAVARYRRRRRG